LLRREVGIRRGALAQGVIEVSGHDVELELVGELQQDAQQRARVRPTGEAGDHVRAARQQLLPADRLSNGSNEVSAHDRPGRAAEGRW
jgi:hypothetical protein